MTRTTTTYVPLESGDRLTREEFHRRYCLRPDIKKAELVKGVVYVPSPLRAAFHGDPHGLLIWWLNSYGVDHPDLHVSDNATVLLDDQNEPRPDICLYWHPWNGRGVRRRGSHREA